ncbi:4a-hydroxytetrahydrobiopterin dehydratase [Rhodococcus antarcticus]|jgi:4a-hydroxytetrahydrobiopterin dehydratase|uniref:Putative pterin-4-alpha-carbinolamine dehydratase n=1 Tax=Rhodococcus antarcticus TaxID=2987751 RepID=A0ABY6NX92_9NOCA|nr:4a-hydroxytetrahydrobiopterin dehydratase [Rhodococcus antarcticus]UZJ23990.1 4a-hydroxytetrahydrobiopterin dehydratase [Rhodococcus antarcticus]
MTTLLTTTETADALAGLPGWELDGPSLVRTAQAPSFPAAIALVTRVGEVAEGMDHHPDIDIRWCTLTFRCATHSEGGITALDVRLAAEISALLAAG